MKFGFSSHQRTATTMALGMMMMVVQNMRSSSKVVVAAFTPTVRRTGRGFGTSTRTSTYKKDGRVSFLFTKTSKLSERQKELLARYPVAMKAATETELEPYHNRNNIDDQMISALSGNGEIKVTAITIRNLVNDAMIQQTLTATPADALSRSMTCGLLLSNGMQKEQTFQLSLNCNGPIRTVVAIANGAGGVRGYVGNPGLADMHISEAVGRGGTVQIVKMHPDWPNPYNGITSIEHGDVDRDVGIYLAESEQRACALAASSKFNGILCTAAGGYIVEQLPGCTEETSAQVEKNLAKLVAMDGGESLPAGLLLTGGTPLDICSTVLEELDMKVLDQIKPGLVCDCSEERLFRAVRLLSRDEVDKIIKEEDKLEARCHFCGKVYTMNAEEVEERFAAAVGDPALDADFEGGSNK
jgi:molecular chaperone Hsp33